MTDLINISSRTTLPTDQTPAWQTGNVTGPRALPWREARKTDAASEPCPHPAAIDWPGCTPGRGAATGTLVAAAVFCTSRFPHALVFRTNYQTHMPGSHSTWAQKSLAEIKLTGGKLVT